MKLEQRDIAHAAQNADGSWREPHDLADHLVGVATLAAGHAQKFGAEDWARLAGTWHDLGKYRPVFQDYICQKSGFEKQNAHIEGLETAAADTRTESRIKSQPAEIGFAAS